MLSDEEVSAKVQRRLIDMEKTTEQHARLERMNVGANAGGVVASLSLIGAMIGSGSRSVPYGAFVVLVTFVMGLTIVYVGRFLDWAIVTKRVNTPAENRQLLRMLGTRSFILGFPAGMAVSSIIFGLYVVYTLTG